jgi:hypothetical protein
VNDFLVVRPDDVVLGVTATECTIAGDLLVAGAGASLTLHVPPQAVSETKVEGASIQGGLQGLVSTITYPLEPGTEIRLDVAGVLTALAGLTIPAEDTTRIELPAGLLQRPRRPAVGAGPVQPVVADGVSALWEYVVRSASSDPLELVPHALPEAQGANDPSLRPLDQEQRATIIVFGQGANFSTVQRLRLSAMGGTLASRMGTPQLEWEHATALGRDQRVRFQQRGVVYPFGFPAVLVDTAVRRIVGDTAALHQESMLRVTDPVRHLPSPGSLEGRLFPFGAAELLTPTLPGLASPADISFSLQTDQPDALAAFNEAIAAVQTDLATKRDEFGTAFRQPIPLEPFALEEHPQDTFNASDVRAFAREADGLRARHEQIIAEGTEVNLDDVPPTTFVPQHVQDAADELNPHIAQAEANRAAAQGRFDAFDLPFLRTIQPTPDELANPDLYATRLAQLGVPVAQGVVAQLQEIARLNGIMEPLVSVPLVSRVLAPAADGLHAVRLTGTLGDVVVHVPLFFIRDVSVPAQGPFGGYSSLDDESVVLRLGPVSADLPGVPVDLVRRTAGPRTTDVQEVHAVTIGAQQTPRALQPVLRSFDIELTDLRTLLPEGTQTRVSARLDDGYLNGGPTQDVIRFDRVRVDFDRHADRSGGFATPTFDADVISDAFGPTDRRLLPGGGDPMAALASMKLFGITLADLLGGFSQPPSILQMPGPDGVPRGVMLTWPEQRLTSVGAFVAHGPEPIDGPDTTSLALTVKQDLSGRSTSCVLTAFTLRLPTPDTEALRLSFGGLTFTEADGRPPVFDVTSFDFSFEGPLRLLKDLQRKASALLGGAAPTVDLTADGVTATFTLRIDDASSGVILMRNIVVRVQVHIPFRGGSPGVRVDFASREAPFQLSIPPFGGGGYAAVALAGSQLTVLDISLEFGGVIAVDFKVVKAEVHALGGVRSALVGDKVIIAGYIRLGGSVSLFGLASVSIELRVELTYDEALNRLAGRATLVLEVDLTLYADKVELDSGLWVIAGDDDPPPPPQPGSAIAQRGWTDYQGAYA